MQFKSQAQRAWMEKHHPEMAKEWAARTPEDAKLPERLGKAPAPSPQPKDKPAPAPKAKAKPASKLPTALKIF